MPAGDPSCRPDVVLGFDAAWGFAPADQTSPALAAAAGALPDVTITGPPVTELRIHGVSGSDGPTMLEHPAALQVAGDAVTGFYRRWSPGGRGRVSVPWKLEAYSWGGLTEKPLASAAWLLLAPFMMFNVAHFMLPPPADPPAMGRRPRALVPGRRGHRLAGVLLRLLALSATVQLAGVITAVTASTVAWQAAGRAGLLPSWMGWYAAWTAGWRIALALLPVAAAVAVLAWISIPTASRYDRRTSRSGQEATAGGAPQAAGADDRHLWLAAPGFWKGEALVRRQRALHLGAALAAAALIAGWPAGQPAAAHWAAVAVAGVVLATAAGLTCTPLAARHRVSLEQEGKPEDGSTPLWCRAVVAGGAASLLLAAVAGGLTDRLRGHQEGAMPGISAFLGILLAAQIALLVTFAVAIAVLARRAPATGAPAAQAAADDVRDGFRPYLGGGLSALVAAIGLMLGGLMTAVLCIGLTRLMGTPEPSGFMFDTTPANALALPWPVYAFGAAPIGLLAGAAAAAVVLFLRYRRYRGHYSEGDDSRPSPVAAGYRDFTAGPAPELDGDTRQYAASRMAVAGAWAVGRLAEDAAFAMALVVGGGMIAVFAAELIAALYSGPPAHPGHLGNWWHGLASAIALLGVLIAGWLVTLLRQAYTDASKRRSIGALWDVATFWPRAVHPLAPPCYAERAVPEIADRIMLLAGREASYHAAAGEVGLERTHGLTVPSGPVLLTGYSQGSIIAPAVVAQLPAAVQEEVALLTLACPVRRLYGRAFPAYFGLDQLTALGRRLGVTGIPGQAGGRWKNLYRKTDFIGSWALGEPRFTLSEHQLSDPQLLGDVDQPCWDPVILVPDGNQTPPPVHRHSGWWPDPRVQALGRHLVGLLSARALPR